MGRGVLEVNIQPYKEREGVTVWRVGYGVQNSCRWASGVTHLDPSVLQDMVEAVAGDGGASAAPACCAGETDPGKSTCRVLHIGVPVLGERETTLERQRVARVLRPVEKHGLLDARVQSSTSIRAVAGRPLRGGPCTATFVQAPRAPNLVSEVTVFAFTFLDRKEYLQNVFFFESKASVVHQGMRRHVVKILLRTWHVIVDQKKSRQADHALSKTDEILRPIVSSAQIQGKPVIYGGLQAFQPPATRLCKWV